MNHQAGTTEHIGFHRRAITLLAALLTFAAGLATVTVGLTATAATAGASGSCTPFSIAGVNPPSPPQPVGLARTAQDETLVVEDSSRILRFADDGTRSTAVESSAGVPTLQQLVDVETDAAGNIYAADRQRDTIYRFDSSGAQTLAIASTDATPNFGEPWGIAVDSAGNIYAADSSSNAVYRFDPSGTQTLVIESSDANPTLNNPFDVAVDGSGNIFAVDQSRNTVYRFDSNGAQTLAVPPSAATPSFDNLRRIALDTTGNIYVTDLSRRTVYRLDPSGSQTLAIAAADATPNFQDPWSVDVDPAGEIHIGDNSANSLYRFDAAGTQTGSLPLPPRFTYPFDVDAATDGSFGVLDTPNQRVHRLDATGAQVNSFDVTNFSYYEEESIAVDDAGNTYVASTGDRTVRRFDSSGSETLAINQLAATPQFQDLTGVDVDSSGNIYVTDRGRDTIYRFDGTGAQTLAIPATAATPDLSTPNGIAVDDAGNIHVADADTKHTYRFDGSGTQSLAIDQSAYGSAYDAAVSPDGATILTQTNSRVVVNDASGVELEHHVTGNSDGGITYIDGGFINALGYNQEIRATCLDGEDPTIDLTVPADGAIVDLDSTVNAAYTCADNVAIQSCNGTRLNGQPIPTNTLGQQTFSVTATDTAQRTTEVTHTYTVVDNTDPTVQVSRPNEGATYALDQNITASYSCNDGNNGSGIDTCVGDVANGSPIDTASLGAKTFTVAGTDNAGNVTEVVRNYMVTDQSQPLISLTTPAGGEHFAQNEAVNAAFECNDEPDGSGIASCVGTFDDGSPIDTSSLGQKSFTVTATDNAGNVRTLTHGYFVDDVTDPVITITNPPDGAVYEQDEVVIPDYTCVDEPGGSGINYCFGSESNGRLQTGSLGTHQFYVDTSDNYGNYVYEIYTYTVVDVTDPEATILTPADGVTFERDQAVVANFSCEDEARGSGIASCVGTTADGAPVDTSTLGTHTFEVVATDGDGNETTSTHTYRVSDITKPTISITSPGANATYTQGQTVNAGYSCADETGGSGMDSCSGSVTDGAPINTSQPGQHQFVVFGQDVAGNTAVSVRTYTVTGNGGGSNDVTRPTVVITTPANGATFDKGQAVIADYACADENGGSGLEACLGSTPDGGAVDTNTAGTHSFWVIAQDAAGNTRIASSTYTVVAPPVTFSDTPAWAADAIAWITDPNNVPPYANGYSNGTFRPGQQISRAQMALWLYNIAGAPDVSGRPDHGLDDVEPWVEDAVRWLIDEDIADGYPDGTFRPKNDISRGQAAHWFHRVVGSPTGSPANTFSDTPAWVLAQVNWLVDPAHTPPYATGYADNTFRPQDNITRAQAARMLYRMQAELGV